MELVCAGWGVHIHACETIYDLGKSLWWEEKGEATGWGPALPMLPGSTAELEGIREF